MTSVCGRSRTVGSGSIAMPLLSERPETAFTAAAAASHESHNQWRTRSLSSRSSILTRSREDGLASGVKPTMHYMFDGMPPAQLPAAVQYEWTVDQSARCWHETQRHSQRKSGRRLIPDRQSLIYRQRLAAAAVAAEEVLGCQAEHRMVFKQAHPRDPPGTQGTTEPSRHGVALEHDADIQ